MAARGKAPGCPGPLKKGPAGILNWLNALRAYTKTLEQKPTPDDEWDRGPDGTMRIPMGATVGGGGASLIPPLSIVDTSTYNDDGSINQAKVKVTYGTICGMQPDSFTPSGSADVDISGDTYFYAQATADLSTIQWSDVSVQNGSSAAPGNTTTIAYRTIAMVGLNADGSPNIGSAQQGDILFAFTELT